MAAALSLALDRVEAPGWIWQRCVAQTRLPDSDCRSDVGCAARVHARSQLDAPLAHLPAQKSTRLAKLVGETNGGLIAFSSSGTIGNGGAGASIQLDVTAVEAQDYTQG